MRKPEYSVKWNFMPFGPPAPGTFNNVGGINQRTVHIEQHGLTAQVEVWPHTRLLIDPRNEYVSKDLKPGLSESFSGSGRMTRFAPIGSRVQPDRSPKSGPDVEALATAWHDFLFLEAACIKFRPPVS